MCTLLYQLISADTGRYSHVIFQHGNGFTIRVRYMLVTHAVGVLHWQPSTVGSWFVLAFLKFSLE
jgi:hypothetical protein